MSSQLRLENFKGLAIKGGGVAGVSYIGALRRWIDDGLSFNQFVYFVGSSAGSLVATMLACRATVDFLDQKLKSSDFSKFLDTSLFAKAKDVVALVERYGWNSGNGLEEWVIAILNELTGNGKITFAQAYQKYGTRLIITTTDVLYPECQLVAMDWKSHPDTTLCSAIRKSCSIPLFFQAVFGEGPEAGHVYIDGGVLDNYPIVLLYDHLPKEQCMGLYLTPPVKKNNVKEQSRPVNSYSEFLSSIVSTWMDAMMGQHIHADDWARTCSIPTELIATEFSAPEEKIGRSIDAARSAMEKFISSIRAQSSKSLPESQKIAEQDARIKELEEECEVLYDVMMHLKELAARGKKENSDMKTQLLGALKVIDDLKQKISEFQ